jgi:hypothetical protein
MPDRIERVVIDDEPIDSLAGKCGSRLLRIKLLRMAKPRQICRAVLARQGLGACWQTNYSVAARDDTRRKRFGQVATQELAVRTLYAQRIGNSQAAD